MRGLPLPFLCAILLLIGGYLVPPALSTPPTSPKASVDLFVATDCPIANACAPEIERLYQAYKTKGVDFRLVFPDRDLDEGEVRQHLADFGLNVPFVIDRDHAFVKRGGATVTPEAVVYNRLGAIAYRGKIDNRYTDFGDRRITVSEFYLRDALDAVLSGKTPAIERTAAIGCLIEQ
ncbi:MAG: redoxin family protein [Verrucomicrobiae bacterium]|nr:redoxin family protein [Verrucomicrobiae bacterium]